ncbi:MAG: glycosyltransferase family 2 protein [Methylacidiphilales bacterium]|nr:glycosyltransferase family 2 protein [Candidatus Methylacidiphilales bacterium]
MPCLNEAETLEGCILLARKGIEKSGRTGEIIVADNGSIDSSREIARRLEAKVIEVSLKGYGSALRAGTLMARGRWIVMGDSDMSYDFSNITPFLEKLEEGNDLVMGCRLPSGGGSIDPGAMPWLNRWIGNPGLSFIGRRLFQIKISDFQCGMRACSRAAFDRMELTANGMEFASEMVVKAALKKMRIAEVPVTLHPDGRSRPPHLRRWRDGWRNLRFMLLFSPRWMFFYPGLILTALGLLLLLPLSFGDIQVRGAHLESGALAVSGMTVIVGFQVLAFALWAGSHPIVRGLRPPSAFLSRCLRFFSLERGLLLGMAVTLLGLGLIAHAMLIWHAAGFGNLNAPEIMRVIIPGTTAISIGVQMIFTSFFLSLLDLNTETGE